MLSPLQRSARVFVSYVRDDAEIVDRLVGDLEKHGVTAWYDRNSLRPGMLWKEEIRHAIQKGDLFVACFSQAYMARDRTYMNEELEVAIDEIRLRYNRTWFIPVLLSGRIPDISISANQRLSDIQYLDFTSISWDSAVQALAEVVTNTVGIKNAQERAWLNDAFPPVVAPEVIHYDRASDLLFEQPSDQAFTLPRYLLLPGDSMRGDVKLAIRNYRESVYRRLATLSLSPLERMVLTELLQRPLVRPRAVDRFFASISSCVAVAFPQFHDDPSLPNVRRLMRECFDQDGEWQLRFFKVAEEPVEAFVKGRRLNVAAR